MSDERLLAYLKKVTGELHKARQRLQQMPSDEPIAVVSAGCRLPGEVDSPEDFWELLSTGSDAISGFPTDRGWPTDIHSGDPEEHGRTYTDRGGFLRGAAEFDPEAFGISPREATAMDPQQRLLLELAWETFERAGVAPSSLRGTDTGVFVGGCSFHYEGDLVDTPEELAGHLLTGNVTSVLSGRVSYTFGLEGPAVTLDTGCSSALVAMHLAARSLRSGECSMALAGGAAVMATPGVFVEFSRQRGLSPDGRCRSFAAGADGTGWSEGGGLVLLERLSDAVAAGHPVLGILKGTAVNQDGASNGLTAPSGRSQQRVIRAALADAGLAPEDVDAVEGHGTGTVLGDPIEANALIETYGRAREAGNPLLLGSVKSNIGHTQAAAGAAGVIKMLLALDRGRLPRSLHIDAPTSEVEWEGSGVDLLTEPVEWRRGERPRRAGVSAFGVSGTNAHVILEEAPELEPALEPETDEAGPFQGPTPWVLSARTPQALRAQAGRLRDRFAHGDEDVRDIGYSLATTRSSYEHRAVLVGRGKEELLLGLEALAAGAVSPDLVTGTANESPAPVFVFPGQGSQWSGMARDLMESSPVFRKRVEECADAFSGLVERSPLDVLCADPGRAMEDRVDVVQPALFSVMVGLAELWRAYGVEPAAVIGHSQGEIAAACVSGALTLREAARVVAVRALALRNLSGHGGMLSLGLSAKDTEALIGRAGTGLSLAAVNSPTDTVVSGDPRALERLRVLAEGRGARARMVPVDYASHSPQVESVREHLLERLGRIGPTVSEVPIISTVTGKRLDTETMDAGYWYDNLRGTVNLEGAVETAHRDGHRMFVEISPHPVLTLPLQKILPEAVVLGTLQRGEDGNRSFLSSLAGAHTAGADVDWSAAFDVTQADRIPLPTYAFQRRRFWMPPRRPVTSEFGGILDNRHYRPRWTAVPALSGSPTGRWLLVAGHDTDTDPPADALTRAGAEPTRVEFDPAQGSGPLAARLREMAAEHPIGGVLFLPGTKDGYEGEVPVPVQAAVSVHRAHAEADLTAPLWYLTSEAVSVAGEETNPVRTALWGLGVSLGAERPDTWGGTVDLPDRPEPGEWDRAVSVLAQSQERQCAVRRAGTFVRRLSSHAEDTVRPWSPEGTVLVTGGLGGVGAQVARSLAEGGAEHLVLVGRRGTDSPGAPRLREELTELGARVTIEACDASDRDALDAVLAAIPEERPLTAVIHAAGVLDPATADDLGHRQLESVLRAKATSARHLHELTRDLPLSAFVMFSSIGALFGTAGQANYTAANAYLDGLAEHRHSLGLPATSVAWTLWRDSGMVDARTERWFGERGAHPMSSEAAYEAMCGVVGSGDPIAVVGDIDWSRFAAPGGVVEPTSILNDLVDGDRTQDDDLAGTVASLPREEALAELGRRVAEAAAAVLGHDGTDVVVRTGQLKNLGFDSVTSVGLRNRLAAMTGLRLPVTLAFDHPSVDAIAEHLHEQFAPDPSGAAAAELERLEHLMEADGDDRVRSAVVERMRSLLWRWDRQGTDTAEETAGDADELRDVTDEEMFELLDNELGSA